MKSYRLSVVIEKDADGYFAFCPELQGCYTQGESYEEALENIKDAIRLHLEDMIERGEDIPEIESISLTSPSRTLRPDSPEVELHIAYNYGTIAPKKC
jgi:predicted RNase H-like HicB family nuclease